MIIIGPIISACLLCATTHSSFKKPALVRHLFKKPITRQIFFKRYVTFWKSFLGNDHIKLDLIQEILEETDIIYLEVLSDIVYSLSIVFIFLVLYKKYIYLQSSISK